MRKAFAIPAILIAFVLGVGIAGASDTEIPTPTPEVVEVPGPTQTIEIEVVREVPGPTTTVEVERIPASCTAAFDALMENQQLALNWMLDVVGDYIDYPDEDLVQFGRRFEARASTLPEFDNDIDYNACR